MEEEPVEDYNREGYYVPRERNRADAEKPTSISVELEAEREVLDRDNVNKNNRQTEEMPAKKKDNKPANSYRRFRPSTFSNKTNRLIAQHDHYEEEEEEQGRRHRRRRPSDASVSANSGGLKHHMRHQWS